MPNCSTKTPVPFTGSPTDAISYIASAYPNQSLFDFKFTVPISIAGQGGINLVPGGIVTGGPCPIYDAAGNVIAYEFYALDYHFVHLVYNFVTNAVTTPGPLGSASHQTYAAFIDAVNNHPIYGGQSFTVNDSYATVCQKILDTINSMALPISTYNPNDPNFPDIVGCTERVMPCSCPQVYMPCSDLAASLNIGPLNDTGIFDPNGQYLTYDVVQLGNNAQIPQPTGQYYLLTTPGYTPSNPFTFTAPMTPDSPGSIWLPCQPPSIDGEVNCDCPQYIDYNDGLTTITPAETGPWDPNFAYQQGNVFTLDWYNDGLAVLMSHPDPNFIQFIGSQNLTNPIEVFELPEYDYNNNQYTNGPSGDFVSFTPPCSDEPGPSCYMLVMDNPSNVTFATATPDDWINGFFLPGWATNLSQVDPYWAGPAGGTINGYILASSPDVQYFYNEGLALLNRSMVCCHELVTGCVDINALNYQPGADLLCPDNDGDGLPDCCLYNATAVAEECLPKLTKEEFLMNVAQKPETRSDVFIERGKTSVFERTQRLAQTPTIGELELHGYGYYKINEQRF